MPSSRPAAFFLTPLAERERAQSRGAFSLRGRRVAPIAGALLAALVIPVALALVGATGGPIQPLGGDVAGAVSQPSQSATLPRPSGTGDPRLAAVRPTDPDGPPTASRGAPPISSLTGYQWPLAKGRVTLPFKEIPGGSRIRNGKRFHDGVDMASFCGDRVMAAHDGVVLAAGRRFDDQVGWIGDLRPYYRLLDSRKMWRDLPIVVVVDDGNGYRSIYAHFREVTVRRGDTVKAGQTIGYEGATGHASGCHVHYGLFSPYETDTFGVRPDIVRKLRVPKYEIARIDPLLVLPGGDVALRTRSIAKAIAAATAAAKAAAAGAGSATAPSPTPAPVVRP